MRYIALVGLTYPHPDDLPIVVAAGGLDVLHASDPEAAQAIASRMIRREPGEACDDVPAVSIPHLLEQGQIAPVESAPGAAVEPQADAPADVEDSE